MSYISIRREFNHYVEDQTTGLQSHSETNARREFLYPAPPAFARTALAWSRQVDREGKRRVEGPLARGDRVEPWSKGNST
ncbi:hypothetical protein CC2G_013383 [Coprinopsis cinerea AmutBmut pab1-1]|nr:hypothetical protein CC2G_013383 [Coprinopsis cinerea AmutBmut pab1-1]